MILKALNALLKPFFYDLSVFPHVTMLHFFILPPILFYMFIEKVFTSCFVLYLALQPGYTPAIKCKF